MKPCAYVASNEVPCRFKAPPGRDLCFWHDPEAPKTNPLVGPLLVRLLGEDVNCEGFQLAGIDLECRRLPGAPLIGASLEGAHLFKTHLEGAHLFGANLRDASLFKAQLAGANLRSADLSGANLLGATIKSTKLEGANFGKRHMVFNEVEGDKCRRAGDWPEAQKRWREAEEVYLALVNNFTEAGRHQEAGDLFYRMMVVKRKAAPRFTAHRWAARFVELLCGYGERPLRIIMAWIVLIFVGSLFYFGLGILDPNGDPVGFDSSASFVDNVGAYGACVYLSVITMTTTGYGDFRPNPQTRAFAAMEALSGSFLMAVFVIVFSHRMTR